MATKKRKNLLTFREYAAFTSFAGKRPEKYTFSNHISPVSEFHPLRVCFAPNTMETPIRSHWLTIPSGLRTRWKPFV